MQFLLHALLAPFANNFLTELPKGFLELPKLHQGNKFFYSWENKCQEEKDLGNKSLAETWAKNHRFLLVQASEVASTAGWFQQPKIKINQTNSTVLWTMVVDFFSFAFLANKDFQGSTTTNRAHGLPCPFQWVGCNLMRWDEASLVPWELGKHMLRLSGLGVSGGC